MSQREQQERLVALMQKWQKLEDDTIKMTTEIANKTTNKLLKQVMEIIRQDSAQHRRVQQFIVDTLTKEAVRLQPEELADIWDLIEKHIAMEEETVRLAEEARKDIPLIAQKYFINYLLTDERKHVELLDRLSEVKKGMYPYAS
jgi:rubrerythrin